MKLEFPYKKGEIINIYDNWETQNEIIGTAKLVEFIRHGRSFILEDTYPESDQIVYNYQEWIIKPLWDCDTKWCSNAESTYKVRYIDTIGMSNSADDEEYESDFEDPKLPKDSFITIHNISCF